MSIRYLAEELYRLTRRVEELEQARLALGALSPERARLDADLQAAVKERDRVRAVLAAKKEKPLI